MVKISSVAVCKIFALLLLLSASSHARPKAGKNTARNLWNCASDIIALCSGVRPGDGRVDKCLNSKNAYLSSMCANRRQISDRLPRQCKSDAEKLCPRGQPDELQLMCLRKFRNQLTEDCWQSLSALQSDGWEPLSSQFRLRGVDTPCTRSLILACGDIAPGYGALRTCVDNNWAVLQDDCGLKAKDMPEEVAPACVTDSLVLCKHIAPGNERVTKCLKSFEGHWNDDGLTLSKDCVSSLKLQEAEMDTACAEDVTRFCGHSERSKPQLIRCLRPHQHELKPGCTIRAHLYDEEKIVSTHVNLHTGRSAEGCAADIRRLCSGVKPGHGLIHQCLMQHRAQLSSSCWVPRGQVVRRNLPQGAAEAPEPAAAPQDPLAGLSSEDAEAAIKWDIEEGAFANCDVDGSGALDIHEFIEAMRRAGRDHGREEIREEFVKADADGSSFIETAEFHALFGTRKPSPPPQAPSAAEDTGPRRDFMAREESLLQTALSSPWVATPLIMAVFFVVYAYRSSVRRSSRTRRTRPVQQQEEYLQSRRGYR